MTLGPLLSPPRRAGAGAELGTHCVHAQPCEHRRWYPFGHKIGKKTHPTLAAPSSPVLPKAMSSVAQGACNGSAL
eukprot:CAMPEP_0171154644 /NCGR_PEP_ID=MMETSP0790-20130122/442_1 /TAXON_ID=2925 /ORGANISM="Alexandrium catenella, Strain OF101" /LENGTH=74 /DNA_ID=CAMNT_0011618741 /DNA_START=19 /DNA_END=240 /DNA_ORIENTATION=-